MVPTFNLFSSKGDRISQIEVPCLKGLKKPEKLISHSKKATGRRLWYWSIQGLSASLKLRSFFSAFPLTSWRQSVRHTAGTEGQYCKS